MSGKRNCYDNAPLERFWNTLKADLIFHRCYQTREKSDSRDYGIHRDFFILCQRIQKNVDIFLRRLLSVSFTNCKKEGNLFSVHY